MSNSFGSTNRTDPLFPRPQNGRIDATNVLSFRESEIFRQASSHDLSQFISPKRSTASALEIQ